MNTTVTGKPTPDVGLASSFAGHASTVLDGNVYFDGNAEGLGLL